jgi:Tol biopolymer transport system component
MSGRGVDLAIVDLDTEQVTRLVVGTPVQYYAWSPDDSRVAYTVVKGWEANSQQTNYDLSVYNIAAGESRTLLTNARLSYGIEWHWSPDGGTIAYISSGQLGSGELILVSVEDGSVTTTIGEGTPNFGPGEGEYAPLWSADGTHLYAVGDGELWRVDAASGEGALLGQIAGWQIRAIVSPFQRPTLWSTDAGRTAWVLASEDDGDRARVIHPADPPNILRT